VVFLTTGYSHSWDFDAVVLVQIFNNIVVAKIPRQSRRPQNITDYAKIENMVII
jgi:hypothetical protein